MILIFPAVAVLLLATQHGCEAPRREEKEPVVVKKQPQTRPLAAGVKFLLAAQDDDGAWRSKTYGQLKGGAATTALLLYALSHLDEPRGEQVGAAVGRAVGFLRPGIEKFGYLCDPDGTPAYPTYSAAMLLVAVDRLKLSPPLSFPPPLREKLVDDLVRNQLTGRQGWQPSDVHYGGWDFVRAERAKPPITSGTNVSVSAMALEALSGCRHEEKAAVLARARADSCLRRRGARFGYGVCD